MIGVDFIHKMLQSIEVHLFLSILIYNLDMVVTNFQLSVIR